MIYPAINNAPLEFLTGFTYRDKKQLLKMSISPAKDKINSSSPQSPLSERAALRERMYI